MCVCANQSIHHVYYWENPKKNRVPRDPFYEFPRFPVRTLEQAPWLPARAATKKTKQKYTTIAVASKEAVFVEGAKGAAGAGVRHATYMIGSKTTGARVALLSPPEHPSAYLDRAPPAPHNGFHTDAAPQACPPPPSPPLIMRVCLTLTLSPIVGTVSTGWPLARTGNAIRGGHGEIGFVGDSLRQQ